MRWSKIILAVLMLLPAITSCERSEAKVCQPGSVTYAENDDAFTTQAGTLSGPEAAQIGGKTVQVDRVIHGPLCNETLAGRVYIACDIQLKPWTDKPNFLDGCEFKVAPDTVIYVASHNDAAYYNGCAACHTSETEAP